MLKDYVWVNEPQKWQIDSDSLSVTTDEKTDFWQETWYGYKYHSGHIYGCELSGEFTFQVRVEGDFSQLYDQAGIMLLVDERNWLKMGVEYSDGAPVISSVLTTGKSDWATGVFPGDINCFWLRLTLIKGCLRLQYSTDSVEWPLLRLCPFPEHAYYFVGVMCCTPMRAGLNVKFSDFKLTPPLDKDLHDLT